MELKGICKAFPGVRALQDVHFEVRPGEIHGLVGKNGAGKSTLINVLTGLLRPDQGEVVVGGRLLPLESRRAAIAAGIGLVPQQVKLFPWLTVAENILCGHLPVGKLGFVRWNEVFVRAQRQLDQLNVPVDARAMAGELRVAQQKMVVIAQALFADAQLIVLDEPTAALPRADAEVMFHFIRQLQARGVSFIYISHHLDEVFAVCDRVTVLRDGQYIGTYQVAELDKPRLVGLISGTGVEAYRRSGRMREGTPVLELRHVSRAGAFHGVSLAVRPGEVVGLAGLQGSGAAEMMRAVYGLEPVTAGNVLVDGTAVQVRHPSEGLACGIAYVTDDRRRLGLIGLRPVRENIALSVVRSLADRLGFLPPRREVDLAHRYVRELDIKTPSVDQPVEFLSGGNQQKVLFARVASSKPRVLLLDQPTQGVDVQAKAEIFRIVDRLSAEGIGVVMLSGELHDLLDNCDRVVVFRDGQIRAEVPAGSPQFTESQILLLIEGG